MASDETMKAAVDAIDTMTEADVEQWLAEGDYTSIGDADLPEAVAQRVAEFAAGADVEGFSFTPLPATPPGVPVPYPNEGTLGRKSGEGQKDFLKITMKEIFISG